MARASPTSSSRASAADEAAFFFVRAPDAAHIDLADGGEGLDVEAGVEAAAYEADAETVSHLVREEG